MWPVLLDICWTNAQYGTAPGHTPHCWTAIAPWSTRARSSSGLYQRKYALGLTRRTPRAYSVSYRRFPRPPVMEESVRTAWKVRILHNERLGDRPAEAQIFVPIDR